MLDDGMHPNAAGIETIVERVAAARRGRAGRPRPIAGDRVSGEKPLARPSPHLVIRFCPVEIDSREVVMPRLFYRPRGSAEPALFPFPAARRASRRPAGWTAKTSTSPLRFFGDVEGHVADEIANALDRVQRHAFTMSLSGVGVFGGRKPPRSVGRGYGLAGPSSAAARSNASASVSGLPADPPKIRSACHPRQVEECRGRTRSRPTCPLAAILRARRFVYPASC